MNKLKYYREKAGLTQQDVADCLGLSKSGYALKEQGRRAFTVEEGIAISDYIKQPIRKIFT